MPRKQKHSRSKNSNKRQEASSVCKYSPVWLLAASRFGNNRWIVYSLKLLRLVILYSDLEYDHWVLVESDWRIVSYCEQPLRVRVRLDSGFVVTVFDMWVIFDSGEEEFREIKYRDQLEQPRVKRQLQAQKTWCRLKPEHHEVFDEDRIRRNPRLLRNWKFILRCLAATHKIDLTAICERVSQLLSTGPKTLGELESSFTNGERGLVRPAIFRLLHSGHLIAPLDAQEISNTLPVGVRR
jgi:hypothetical protein